jgi:hypothetical protein
MKNSHINRAKKLKKQRKQQQKTNDPIIIDIFIDDTKSSRDKSDWTRKQLKVSSDDPELKLIKEEKYL